MSKDVLIRYMKSQLQPGGTAPVVRLGFFDGVAGGSSFHDKEFIDRVIDELERRFLTHELDPITPLEQLAIELLLSSLYIRDPVKRIQALASFERWERTHPESDPKY